MTYTDFIWNNNALMFAIDAFVVLTAILAGYFGLQVRKMIVGKLKNSFLRGNKCQSL